MIFIEFIINKGFKEINPNKFTFKHSDEYNAIWKSILNKKRRTKMYVFLFPIQFRQIRILILQNLFNFETIIFCRIF